MPWLALTLEVDAVHADALSDALIEAGAHSVWMDPQPAPRLTVLASLDADPGRLIERAARAAGVPAPGFTAGRLEDADWVKRSQAQFAPVRIGERLWIGPTWCAPPAGLEAVVRLDPGLAFGTGSHPSTRLALRFLERSVRGGERVLDYGCGSGILGIAAAKLGASSVDAVDVDEDALRTAAENARDNGVRLRLSLPEELAPGDYDLVVSNILAQPLILLAPLLAAKTAPGGALALSGILEAQAAEVTAAYAPFLSCEATQAEEGWALVVGRRL